MSELRQRRGESETDKQSAQDVEIAKLRAELEAIKGEKEKQEQEVPQQASAEKPMTEEEEKKQFAEEIASALENSRPKPVKGTSDEAKACKARLDADPFNLQYIFDLGMVYAEDVHYERCCNVMLRGWKRVHEFEDPAVRFAFLATLAQASLKTKKYRQALAVLNDMEAPNDDEEQLQHFHTLRCMIHAETGDLQKALQAWSKAIEGKAFEQVIGIWSSCLCCLRKVGALEVTRSTLADLAGTEQNMKQIEAVEKLVNLREEVYANDGSQEKAVRSRVTKFVVAVGVVVLLLVLYYFEKHSLSQMKLAKGASG